MMRIGIDARLYGPRNGGLGRYIQKLIENLEKIDTKNEYIIFLYYDNFALYQPDNPRFKKVLAGCRWYTLKEQFLMPYLIKKEKIDLMHFPHFNVPIFYNGNFIVTIHDLIITHFPSSRATTLNPLIYQIKLWGYKLVISQAIKKAKRIIAVSQTTKRDIVKSFRANPEKIAVIYQGVSLTKLFDKKEKPLTIKKPYLLYVGNAYPHKNLDKLLMAFKIFLDRFEPDMRLVLVGKEDYFYYRLKKYARDLKLTNKVIFTGYVTDRELAWLYKNALLYVFPSLMEGFGLPPLEAMNFDLPVVSSNASCLPEILGDSVVYFNPNNENEIAEVIFKVVSDKKLQERLKYRGKKNVRKFDWKKCAAETLRIYKKFL